MKIGSIVYGAAAAAAGIVDLAWGRLDPAHQPLQALGDNLPGQRIIPYIIAIALVIGGAAVLADRTRRFGAIVIGVVYAIFALFWLPRFYTAPLVLGVKAPVYLGVLAGVCNELIVVCAAIFLYASGLGNGTRPLARAASAARVVFALSCVCFGLVHLTDPATNMVYVPAWMPFGQAFWVAFTGVAFILAGIAILIRTLDVLAARLLALMWLIISAVTLIPNLASAPQYQVSWGGNAYNILAAASAWILAEWLAKHGKGTQPVFHAKAAGAIR
jgi:uncharacterized membrane protein